VGQGLWNGKYTWQGKEGVISASQMQVVHAAFLPAYGLGAMSPALYV
jgi:hypothetical protein